MTNRPSLRTEGSFLPGLVALALFCVLAATFLTASFPNPVGFSGDASITAAIGYAMFDLTGAAYPSEGFLVPFEIIDLALVAALGAAVMLAKTEEGGRVSGALRFQTDADRDGESAARADGGRETPATDTTEDR